MKPSLKLGRAFGIDIYVHWSFLLVPMLVLFSTIGSGQGVAYTVMVLLFSLAIFGCVLLHELGHALMARVFGVGTHDITLLAIGGLARLTRMPRQPIQEFLIALAGPAVNVAIFFFLFSLLTITQGVGGITAVGESGLVGMGFLFYLMVANLTLVIFNMIPAFPMDGGRVLRSFLAFFMPHNRATLISGRLAQVIAVVFGVFGFLYFNVPLMLIALFVFFAASAEVRTVTHGIPLPEYYRPPMQPSPPFYTPDPDIQYMDERSDHSTKSHVVDIVYVVPRPSRDISP